MIIDTHEREIMQDIKHELIAMLNEALKLEYQANIQYLTHAELVTGLYAEPIIARFRELAGDEAKHAETFRTLIADYLDGEPCMEMASAHPAQEVSAMLTINLHDEQTAIDFYKTIYKKIVANKDSFPYAYEKLEHDVRHIIMEEMEHMVELKILLGNK